MVSFIITTRQSGHREPAPGLLQTTGVRLEIFPERSSAVFFVTSLAQDISLRLQFSSPLEVIQRSPFPWPSSPPRVTTCNIQAPSPAGKIGGVVCALPVKVDAISTVTPRSALRNPLLKDAERFVFMVDLTQFYQ